jgi:hypothetical protein
MKVNLIFILLIILLTIIKSKKFDISLINNIPVLYYNNMNITLSTNMSDSIKNYLSLEINCSNANEVKLINYYYLKYNELEFNECNDTKINNNSFICENEFLNGQCFQIVNFTKSLLNYQIDYILSLNTFLDSLILLDYINKSLIIENSTEIENNHLIAKENLCYNNSLKNVKNKKFICKLDYILFGHEDLKKDDVYLAKEIKEKYSIALLDNLLNYSIFPDEYLDYFFTSFFSELNDGCEKNEHRSEDYENLLYYITCPKKKIEIYTKRRKLNVIINKFSYRITDLFNDDLDFLHKIENDDKYYFNIVFEKDRHNFTLGKGFFLNKTIAIYNESTYIFSYDRNNYTEDLTDINSDQFEKWLYILTTFSFTFLLLIFTTLGCIHSRKVNKELKEMLK